MSQITSRGANIVPPGDLNTLTGNTGGPVGPDGAGNINILGADTVLVAGNPGTNTLTITATFPWIDVIDATVSLAVNTGYTLNRATPITATLPAVAAYGSIIEVVTINTGLGTIAQNAGQTIWFSTVTKTTTGAGGSLTFTTQYGTIRLLCTTANTDFTVLSSRGSFTLV